MKTLILIPALAIAMALTGCSVTQITPAQGKTFDVQRYERVHVEDFKDGVTAQTRTAQQAKKEVEMAIRTKSFPDRIAIELGAHNVFQEVVRTGTPDASTLVIGGTITRCDEGDVVLKMMVGMGAGTSRFDAMIEFRDGGTSELLATQQVDLSSWVGGGGIAATQTPETFMGYAARQLAFEVGSAKNPEIVKAKPRQAATRK
jgi:hypothetical protein